MIKYFYAVSLLIFLAGCDPTVRITSPQDGATFETGETITFTCTARDIEDGELSGDSIAWTSAIDGPLGTGNEFNTDELSPGAHTITVTATDSAEGYGTDEITVTVGQPASTTTTSAPSSTTTTVQFTGAEQHPFGSHAFAYVSRTIKPGHVSQTQMDDDTKAFYEKWKAHYLKSDCGQDQYYVWSQGVSDPEGIATSEGMGYGMMIAAFMAGYDPAAKAIFNGLYRFVQDHPSESSSDLMAWLQVTDCQTGEDGAGPASDGDIDIAFALFLADAQWGSQGEINYRAEALRRTAAVLAYEINKSTYYVHIGDPAIFPSHQDGTRTSDFIFDHFRTFEEISGDALWSSVIDRCYTILAKVQNSSTGLLPDFVRNAGTAPAAAGPYWLESPYDGHYYYNACRDPWRIGTDYLVSGDARALSALGRINSWIHSSTSENPAHVNNGYLLNGTKLPGDETPELAFLAPLGVSAMVDSGNQEWLNALWDLVVAREINDELDGYFGNTIKMLTMIVMSGNWWAP